MDTTELEIIPATGGGNLAATLTKAEIDTQIATAHSFPRHLPSVQRRIMDMATIDDESAEESLYAVKRGGKVLKGPSIRFAEILMQSYGNCRGGARVVHVDRDEGYVEAEGIFHDLETNSSSTQRVRRRILDKQGKVFTEDMIIVTGNAACSIAKRNAILGGVPKPLWRRAYEHVERVVAGDVKTLVERREAAIKAFAVWGVSPEQILEYLEVKTVEDITSDHLVILTGARSAIKNGEETVESVFFGTARAAARNDRANPFGAKTNSSASSPPQAQADDKGEPAEVAQPDAGSPSESSSRDETATKADRGAAAGSSPVAVTFDDLQALSDRLWGVEQSGKAVRDAAVAFLKEREGAPMPPDVKKAFDALVDIHEDRALGQDRKKADTRAAGRLAGIGIETPEAA